MSTPQHSMPHTDDETLAAYVDGGLSSDLRQQTEQHLVACEDCYAVWQSVSELRASEAPANVVTGKFGDAVRYAFGAAAAAAIVVLIAVPVRQYFNPGTRPLMKASKEWKERPFVPRPSADFPYKPAKVVFRNVPDGEATNTSLDDMSVQIAADQVIASRRSNAHAKAVAHLFLKKPDDAIVILEREVAANSRDTDLWNDLAVAYLLVGANQKALDAADRALSIKKKPLYLFNRAIALGGLSGNAKTAAIAAQYDKAAIAAWKDYLKLDSSSEWADEARTNLAKLQNE